MSDIKKVVLAYSGGLDTSVIIPWLKENYGCEVICFCADIGQGEDLSGLEAKALASGNPLLLARSTALNETSRLERLERAGWLESEWELDADRPGPRRRLYTLTAAGREAARPAIAHRIARRRAVSAHSRSSASRSTRSVL